MENFFTTIPGIIISIAGSIAIIATAVFYAVGVFKGKSDNADDRLINILKETVDQLEIKVNQQSKDIESLTRKVDELEKENGTLIEVLQGRDKNTLDFQKQMLEAMKIGMETNGLAKHTSEKLTELMGMMGDHLKAVEALQDKDSK